MLGKLKEEKVFAYFEELSMVPRGSYDNEKISEYLVDFATRRGLSYSIDSAKNIVIRKPGTKGKESQGTIILQGHMDMVCEAEANVQHNFNEEPLSLIVDGDFIKAEGTTLGADNGVALAYALAILESDDIEHPPLEVLFTTDEEVGMLGAQVFDYSQLEGKVLINLDSEEEGHLLVSCAGGVSAEITFLSEAEVLENEIKSGTIVDVRVSGLKGGHSGMDINKNRMNATVLLGRLLFPLVDHCNLILFEGGKADNVITRDAVAKVWFDDKEEVWQKFIENSNAIKNELAVAEPGLDITYQTETGDCTAASLGVTRKILSFINAVPQGVQVMSSEMEGLVESSMNIGVAKADQEKVVFGIFMRSQKASYLNYMYEKISAMADGFGALCKKHGYYPPWEYRAGSDICSIMAEVYREKYGKEMVIEAIHAGLECGIFSSRMPGVDMVSIGPDIFDVHSPSERLSISSTRRVYEYLTAVLHKLA